VPSMCTIAGTLALPRRPHGFRREHERGTRGREQVEQKIPAVFVDAGASGRQISRPLI